MGRYDSTVERGPLSRTTTIYETPEGRHCCVVFHGGNNTGMSPLKRGADDCLRVGYLGPNDLDLPWSDTEFDWIAPELLKPVGDLYPGED